jgi:hypothetical protein
MHCKVSVTFEFEERQPMTWRGEVKAINPETIMGRATREARKNLKPKNWSSAVCVILERLDQEEEVETEEFVGVL